MRITRDLGWFHNVVYVDVANLGVDYEVEPCDSITEKSVSVVVTGKMRNRRKINSITIVEHTLGGGVQLLIVDTPNAKIEGGGRDTPLGTGSMGRGNGLDLKVHIRAARSMTVTY
jgi:hypothetical protein